MSTQDQVQKLKDAFPKREPPSKIKKWSDKSSAVRSQEVGNKSSIDFQSVGEKPDNTLPSSGSGEKPDNTLPETPKPEPKK